jgi:hypothetical protein
LKILNKIAFFTLRNFIDLPFVITAKEITMKKALTMILLLIILTMNACAPQMTAAPTPLSTAEPTASVDTQTPIPVSPTEVDPSAVQKRYTNKPFGLSFQYPSNWFGPDEYGSGQTLRVSVGSDKVYPYGEPPEKPSEVKNSYLVVVQYTKNNQNPYWKDTYQSLANLKDGESLSGARSLVIRVRQLNLGMFKGFEFISTLSETAQTDPVYAREVMLVDEQSNLLTIFGTPNNVEIGNGAKWREVYRMIDETNLTFFHEIVESITIE